MVGLDAGQALHAPDYVGHVAEHVFHVLRRVVGHIYKCAERGHIHEVAVVHPAYVAGEYASVHDGAGCPLHLHGNAQAAGVIIR